MKVELGQIEKNDIPLLRTILNQDFTDLHNIHFLLSNLDLNNHFDNLYENPNIYLFSIKRINQGDFAKSITGFCGISEIDWVARHGELLFLMSNTHGKHLTIQNNDHALIAFKMLISYCFNELNLNKVWIEVPQGLDIKSKLESLNFVAEGVRSFSRMIKGNQVSSTIFSLLSDDFMEE